MDENQEPTMIAQAKPVYSSQDLISGWAAVTTGLEPTPRLAVFGDPVEHSLSPQMHDAALKQCQLAMRYVRVHVPREDLEFALRAARDNAFLGVNLTIPHKTVAAAFLDEIDERASQLGGVNTVVIRDGRMTGFNTDGPGFVRAVRAAFSVDLRDMRILILGAGGGAGQAIAAQCAMEGCDRLVLVNRTPEKAAALAESLRPYFSGSRLLGPVERLAALEWSDANLRRELDHTDLIVNCTSLGLRSTDAEVLPAHLLAPCHLVFDPVYRRDSTRLLLAAERVGARAVDGLPLLLHQGALSFEYWFERAAPLEAMRKALEEARTAG